MINQVDNIILYLITLKLLVHNGLMLELCNWHFLILNVWSFLFRSTVESLVWNVSYSLCVIHMLHWWHKIILFNYCWYSKGNCKWFFVLLTQLLNYHTPSIIKALYNELDYQLLWSVHVLLYTNMCVQVLISLSTAFIVCKWLCTWTIYNVTLQMNMCSSYDHFTMGVEHHKSLKYTK